MAEEMSGNDAIDFGLLDSLVAEQANSDGASLRQKSPHQDVNSVSDREIVVNLNLTHTPDHQPQTPQQPINQNIDMSGIETRLAELIAKLDASHNESQRRYFEEEISRLNQKLDNAEASKNRGFEFKHKRPILGGGAALVLLLGAGIGFLRFTDDGQELLKKAKCEIPSEEPCLENTESSSGLFDLPSADDSNDTPIILAPPIPSAPSDFQQSSTDIDENCNYVPQNQGGIPGEGAPGLPRDLCDSTYYLSNPQYGIENYNIIPGNELRSTGTEPMLMEIEEGIFVPDNKRMIRWIVLGQYADGRVYKIRMLQKVSDEREIYVSDQTMADFLNANEVSELNSDSVTDRELERFLLSNNIIPNYISNVYVEIVGANENTILRCYPGGCDG